MLAGYQYCAKKVFNLGDSTADGSLIRAEFSLFEELATRAVGWELDFCQFSHATAPFFIEQIAGSSVMISRAVLPARFYQQGAVAPGYRTVSLLASGFGPQSWRWCGESVTPHSLLVMPLGGDFESVSAEGLDTLHLTLPIRLLSDVAESHFGQPLHRLMPNERVFCANGGASLLRLRHLLQKYAPGQGGTQEAMNPPLAPLVEREMAYMVLVCLYASHIREPVVPRGKRWKVLDMALREITAAQGNSISVAQLVSVTGASRRTLENAFRDVLGVSPATFIKALKLHRLNRALLNGDASVTGVAELGQLHGFRHLGQLAADYRHAFGELPSATLHRQPGRPVAIFQPAQRF